MLSCIGFVTAFVVKFPLYRWQQVGRRCTNIVPLYKCSSKLLTMNVSSFRGSFWIQTPFPCTFRPVHVYINIQKTIQSNISFIIKQKVLFTKIRYVFRPLIS